MAAVSTPNRSRKLAATSAAASALPACEWFTATL